MKKIYSIIILIQVFFVSNVFAVETDNYIIEKPDGSVAIVHYVQGSNDSLETVVNQLGFMAMPISTLKSSYFPLDRKDREFWARNDNPFGSKIKIDTAKKALKESEKAVKEDRKRELLKMTPVEYQEAKDLGIVR